MDLVSLDNEKARIQIESQESGYKANLIEKKSRQAMVNEAIQLLGRDDAQVLTLFYKGEQTLEEMGVIMGMVRRRVPRWGRPRHLRRWVVAF